MKKQAMLEQSKRVSLSVMAVLTSAAHVQSIQSQPIQNPKYPSGGI